jgi:hypothetical protein
MQRGLWYNPNMSAAIPVTIPLINPNENEARLVALHIRAGQKIRAGGLLATLETTKSTFELTAEKAGFIAGISAKPGPAVRIGRRRKRAKKQCSRASLRGCASRNQP